MTLTIYADDFETESLPNGGLGGRVFVEDGSNGVPFSRSISSALGWIVENGVRIDEILFCYRKGDEQMFRRFSVSGLESINNDSPVA